MKQSIGVSLSGGGYRAAAFGLGSLLYLSRVESLRNSICSISSVSGGSLTNAYVGYCSNFRSADQQTFRMATKPLAKFLAHDGVPLERLPKLLGLTALIGIGIMILGVLMLRGDLHLFADPAINDGLRISGGMLIASGLFITFGSPFFFFRALNELYAIGLNGALFTPTVEKHKILNPFSLMFSPRLPKNATLLKDLSRDVDHILCATDLSTGTHFLMAPRFLLSTQLGNSPSGNIPIATAVLASAAFPGVFAPVRLSIKDFAFDPRKTIGINTITLADGGIHDNLGTPFSVTTSRRERHPLLKYSTKPSQLIIVNSSSSKQAYVQLPQNAVMARLLGLFRQIAVIHDSNSAARATALEEIFLRALVDRGEALGVLVSIIESPIEICEEILADDFLDGCSGSGVHALRLRAKSMLELLSNFSMDRTDWDGLRRRNQEVPTTLNALGADTVAELIFHGYVLTMVKCYLFLEQDIDEGGLPEISTFKELCAQN